MISYIVLGSFLLALLICLFTGTSLVFALMFGLLVFIFYARYRNCEMDQIRQLIVMGLSKCANILEIFLLIGLLTALWRASGTIPFIVYYGIQVIHPAFFVVSVFLINCLVSFLIGTSFGTVSTVGVICMILARLNGVSPSLAAGAIVSGIFYGDRCSPMSSSASLVASLTETDLYSNIRRMFRSSAVPFVLTCLLYQLLGGGVSQMGGTELLDEFPQLFNLHWVTVIPAAAILVLSLFKIDVKLMMGISILLSTALALTIQGLSPMEIIRYALTGFYPENDSALMALLVGGGVTSMIQVSLIVAISSSFFGLLQVTGLLNDVQRLVTYIRTRFGSMAATSLAGLLTGAFSCNQTLATMLTCEVCRPNYQDKEQLALDLEDSVILLAAMIPWSIAGSVPLSTLETGQSALLLAFYLYLVPLYRILKESLLRLVKKY